ncbi:hypothetical protein [Cupriavidus necator]|uniref:hypothetical protein n=1 Tax=Cupriavidus necator TaxID=106590 RepID=UPI000691DD3D|nr:hypothetical protein [Cupriavidus necator]
MEGLIDLRQEVRQFSRDLLQRAASSTPGSDNDSDSDRHAYDTRLRQLIDRCMRSADPRLKILCYAAAAELGIPVDLQADECRQAMSGGRGFALRVLFWAAHRRMLGARRVRMPGQMPAPSYPW